jgi:hypothetical protein
MYSSPGLTATSSPLIRPSCFLLSFPATGGPQQLATSKCAEAHDKKAAGQRHILIGGIV